MALNIVAAANTLPVTAAPGFIAKEAKVVPVPPADGEVSLRDRPIMVQRGADFNEPQARVVPLNTDGTVAGNRRVNTEGVVRVWKAPTQAPRMNQARIQGPREIPPGSMPPPAPYAEAARGYTDEQKLAAAALDQPAAALPAPVAEAVAAAQPSYAPPPKRVMTKVVMTAGGLMMKIVAVYPEVYISPTLIVLGAIDDGESSIVEPPRTPPDAPPLNLVIAGKSYDCMGAGLSFVRDGMTYYTLLRVVDDQ